MKRPSRGGRLLHSTKESLMPNPSAVMITWYLFICHTPQSTFPEYTTAEAATSYHWNQTLQTIVVAIYRLHGNWIDVKHNTLLLIANQMTQA